MHIPDFPPKWKDFAPGDPGIGEPPLPNFIWNPRAPTWLPAPTRQELLETYGYYATQRAEAMVPPNAGIAAARRAAEAMAGRLSALYGYPAPTRTRVGRVGRPTVVEKPVPTEVHPDLVAAIQDDMRRTRERPTLANVRAWAGGILDVELAQIPPELAQRWLDEAAAPMEKRTPPPGKRT